MTPPANSGRALMPYLVVGVVLGIVQVKAGIVSWYRIQEMFRFQSFHMYGVLGSACVTAGVSLWLLRRFGVRARTGDAITLEPKVFGTGTRYWLGGAIFGIGWAMTGACPGPVFALIGAGETVFVVTALAALMGAWLYGMLRPRLMH